MDQRQSQAPIVVVGTAGLDGQVAAAIEHAARRLSSEEEREQVLGIKDLWSLSCDDPQFAIAIGQCGPLLDRLLELCSLASCPSYTPSPSLPPGPSWKLVILALHCLWNLAAYEENKPTVVLHGGVEVVLSLFNRARAVKDKYRDEVFLCCSAILQNVSESHYRSGARNQLQEAKALDLVASFIEPENWAEATEKTSIWNSWLGLQPFVPLLSLTSGNGDNVDRDMLSAVGFAALCLEKFSGAKRYRKKLWHDLALNGGIQPLKSLLRSSLLSGRLERVRTAVAAVFRNLDIDTSDVGVAIDPSSYETDLSHIFDRKDSFADCVIVFPQVGTGSRATPEREIYCHRAVLAARCKVFAVQLSRWDRSGQADEQPREQNSSGPSTGAPPAGPSRIIVSEFDYPTMKRVLEYIYTDRPALDWLCAVDVLRAADIYGLDRLKQMCEDLIVQGLDLENVGYLLELADFHNASQLGRACVEFLCRRHAGNFAAIEASPQFEALLQNYPAWREQIEGACRTFTSARHPGDKPSSAAAITTACAGPDPMRIET
ncbi:BTB/POZ domain containing protein [Acanthamoeba castellanii str. Neff]|uniref:BTB/POZ domain containing protein n=1 Tax=Acanthamoeba castellanii (strain ATCC 30010 / Neff) TaxID=1257118 RepID=L8H228_ACACF|nr:BTB/POZ domain containing protein [Acanthamoeba castellanii str. Neff]ELR18818.1 BTB/POZ domain containing protein [Acanthamoeba castellanii str. Neff]